MASYIESDKVQQLISSFVNKYISVKQGLYVDSSDLLLAIACAATVENSGIEVPKLFQDNGSAILSEIVNCASKCYIDNGGRVVSTVTQADESIFTCIERPDKRSMIIVNMGLVTFPSTQELC